MSKLSNIGVGFTLASERKSVALYCHWIIVNEAEEQANRSFPCPRKDNQSVGVTETIPVQVLREERAKSFRLKTLM